MSKEQETEDCILEDKTGIAFIHLWNDSEESQCEILQWEEALRDNKRTTFISFDPLMKELKRKELLTNIKNAITLED